jgi:hypothetical protein
MAKGTPGNQGAPRKKAAPIPVASSGPMPSPQNRRTLRTVMEAMDSRSGGWLAVTFLLAVALALAPLGLQIMGIILAREIGVLVLCASALCFVVAIVMMWSLNRNLVVVVVAALVGLMVVGWRTMPKQATSGFASIDPDSVADAIYKRLAGSVQKPSAQTKPAEVDAARPSGDLPPSGKQFPPPSDHRFSPLVAQNENTNPNLPINPNTVTLRDLFLRDDGGESQWCTVNHLKYSESGKQFEVAYCVAWHSASNTKWIKVFIPSLPETAEIVTAVSDITLYKDIIPDPAKDVVVSQKQPGESTITSDKDAKFSGRLFVYHENELTAEELGDLTKLYSSKSLSVQFRGNAYLIYRQAEARADAKTAHR